MRRRRSLRGKDWAGRMFEEIGRHVRGAYDKRRKLTFVDWLVILLSFVALVYALYTGVVELRRQGRSREALAQLKAARLAATVISSECYGSSRPFADFSTDDGFAPGVAKQICELGGMPGTVRLLQTDSTGYDVQSIAYFEDEFVAVYDADGTWKVYRAQHRLTTTFTPDK